MSIMAKTPSGYKKIGSAYLGERPVDKVFNANGDVIYALQRELTGVPPLLFKGKEQSELLNYRIYGDTVDGNSVGDLVESGQHAGEYKVDVTVEGKNLFDKTAAKNATAISRIDGGEYVNGAVVSSDYISVKPNAIYTNNSSFLSTGSAGIAFYDVNKQYLSGIQAGNSTANIPYTYTTPNNAAYMRVSIYTYSGGEGFISVDDFSVNEGSEPLPYEPYHALVTTPIYLPEQIRKVGDEAEYIDYVEQKQHRVRKNLLQNTATSQTINGVTFTVNSDGSVTCNGECVNRVASYHIKNGFKFNDETKRYILTGCPKGGERNSTYVLEYSNAVNSARTDSGDGVYFTPYSAADYPNAWVRIMIFVGYTCNNLTFYPMIRKADITDDTYEPYIENTDLNVTLPALPTIKGTNTMSIDTEVQPSRMDIKGRIKSLT